MIARGGAKNLKTTFVKQNEKLVQKRGFRCFCPSAQDVKRGIYMTTSLTRKRPPP